VAFDINDRSTWAWIHNGAVTESWAIDGYAINPRDRHSFYQFVNGRPILHQCPMETKTQKQVFNPMLNACVWSSNVTEADIYQWAVEQGLVTNQR